MDRTAEQLRGFLEFRLAAERGPDPGTGVCTLRRGAVCVTGSGGGRGGSLAFGWLPGFPPVNSRLCMQGGNLSAERGHTSQDGPGLH